MKDKKLDIGIIGIILIVLLGMTLLFPIETYASGEITLTFEDVTDPRLEELSAVQDYDVLQIWHYSDGRWGNSTRTVSDGDIGGDLRRLEEE